jgi:hypothetical protein
VLSDCGDVVALNVTKVMLLDSGTVATLAGLTPGTLARSPDSRLR